MSVPGRCLTVVWLLLCGGASAPEPQALVATPQFRPVVPGLDYAHVVETNQPWSIHIARLERGRRGFHVRSLLAKGQVRDVATVTEQIEGTDFGQAKPVMAVNGDFFEIRQVPYRGDPEGLQICDGELVSLGASPAFWVDRNGGWHLDEIVPRAEVAWPDGRTSPLEINGPTRTNRAALFTPTFGTSTLASNKLEFVLAATGKGPWLPLRANEALSARVLAVNYRGNSTLEAGQMVLAVDPSYVPSARVAKPGQEVRLSTAISPNLSHVETAVAGWPILVSHDPAREWKIWSRRSDQRAPRTAIGYNARHLFLVVVDGRVPWHSMGMTYRELATLMRQLGCTEAMNLDGGGSSTFWLEGQVMNFPSDFIERRVANALVILRSNP